MSIDGVSAVMPVYEPNEEWLETAVRSVVEQTYDGDMELVIIDDGSPTPVEQVLPDDLVDNDIVRIIRQENAGFTAASNTAFQTAEYDLIAPIGDDDIWDEEKIEKQVERMEETGCDIMFSYSYYIDETGHTYHENTVNPPDTVEEFMIHFTGPVYESLLVRREVFEANGYLDEEYAVASDAEFFFRVWPYVSKGIVREPLVAKRWHTNNIGSETDTTVEEERRLLEQYCSEYSVSEKKRRQVFANLYRRKGKQFFRDGATHRARQMWRRAIRYRPSDYRAWGLFLSSFSETSYNLSRKAYQQMGRGQ
ncbi:MAG: glycosyltransferase family 2 protein [Candidatus Nanohaloarchaea archaeon]